jgi:hypothetical protein
VHVGFLRMNIRRGLVGIGAAMLSGRRSGQIVTQAMTPRISIQRTRRLPRSIGCQRLGTLITWPGRALCAIDRQLVADYSTHSATSSASSPAPRGITGIDKVEFFGEPSMSLSEWTM